MRIGIDASRANNQQKTGVEWYAFHVIEELKKLIPSTHEVVLYTKTPLTGTLAALPTHWSQKVLSWPPQRLWTQCRLSIEMLCNPPDVLWIPAHVPPLIHPKKTIMTLHDVAAIKFPQSYNWFERWYTTWSANYALTHIDTIITPSECTKQELLTINNNPQANITVIHNGYNNSMASRSNNDTSATTIRTKYVIITPYFLTISRLEEKKNTVRIIHAFTQFRAQHKEETYQLVLVGKPGHGYEKVMAAIDTSPYKKDIITPGWVEQADLPAICSQAQAFVYPSLYEGFGIPILEAFAAGIPVITSKHTSTEEIANGAALLVDPLETKEIANAMEHIITDTAHTKELIKKGTNRVAQFSWQACAKQTAAVLIGEEK
ncbi:MAG: glycosyltransferase family 4 protein [Candidatus Magasanikbacteria bacterium]|uniref:Glycosyltransferase family 1 protein n=1 Tax=Candidatus Magasanikbacteria bacterium CG10_big_fil_rev_8_21_14_0_10_38_6 TaxID=1974647 RepID=A0A2M6P0P5_9BACT|nr:glycosyltransferase family 4 protein [Candidatus Magasanikbacteria bacterium]NCS71713.1 glycosyltransferase family 4 protein [Candidatus Magasanikbacteria bacterium]PIR77284.1 MAG: hypothetical protein COU30_03350 [Candidatus Magasanikbacteria bacterium CG10_big_fil_rev_8_21_14_0_10_38_6]